MSFWAKALDPMTMAESRVDFPHPVLPIATTMLLMCSGSKSLNALVSTSLMLGKDSGSFDTEFLSIEITSFALSNSLSINWWTQLIRSCTSCLSERPKDILFEMHNMLSSSFWLMFTRVSSLPLAVVCLVSPSFVSSGSSSSGSNPETFSWY